MMDPSNRVEQVQNSIKESEEKIQKLKEDIEEMKLVLQIHRCDADSRKKLVRQQISGCIDTHRERLDKGTRAEQHDIVDRMVDGLTALLNTLQTDLGGSFANNMHQDRAILNEALSKVSEEYDSAIMKERAKVDTMIEQSREQIIEFENELSKSKSLMEGFIQQEDVHVNMNGKEQDGIYVPKFYWNILMDTCCPPHVLMRFKVHMLKELYSDTREYYDSREEMAMFGITEPETNIEFGKLLEACRYFGYVSGTQLYYMNPGYSSDLSTRFVKIKGQEEVNQMVHAHANQGTKICHLYIVDGCRSNFHDGMSDMESGGPWDYDRWSEQDDMSEAADHPQE